MYIGFSNSIQNKQGIKRQYNAMILSINKKKLILYTLKVYLNKISSLFCNILGLFSDSKYFLFTLFPVHITCEIK